jgi:hypothetical protein
MTNDKCDVEIGGYGEGVEPTCDSESLKDISFILEYFRWVWVRGMLTCR